MGTKELVGTIEQVEPHQEDAKTSPDPWHTANQELTGLARRLRETYRSVADDSGPSEEEVRSAFTTIISAWSQVAGSVGAALQDPEVKGHLKSAVGALASALGATISGLGTELTDEEE